MADKKNTRKAVSSIDPMKIRYNDYTRTLLAEGLRTGRIKSSDCNKFCASLAHELCGIMKSYIGNASDRNEGISGADAAEMLRSLLFTVDTYLISLEDHGKAMKKLKSVTPEAIHGMSLAGRGELRTLQFEALSLCFKAGHDFTGDRLPAYTEAVKKCRSLILSYDREYFTHIVTEEPCYPTAIPFSPIGGIKYIRRYLRQLTCENDFCLSFDRGTREEFFDAVCRSKAKENGAVSDNVYKYFLIGALICRILKKEAGSLLLTESDCKAFYELVRDLDDAELSAMLEHSAGKLTGGNSEYNAAALSQLIPSIICALREESLESVAVVA